jgi:hypothetical protein
MAVAGWCYRSFANSFTLCLIWSACAARVAFDWGCAFFCSFTTGFGLVGRCLWNTALFFSLFTVHCSLFTVSLACLDQGKTGQETASSA